MRGFGPHDIDVQKPVLKGGAFHLHAVGEDEGPQESAGCYAPVELGAVLALPVTPTGDDELAVLHLHLQLVG